jgi:hypothetical protein
VNLAISFVTFTLLVAGMVFAAVARYFPPQSKVKALAVFALWMLYAGAIGYAGPFSRPPGIVFFLVPQIAWIVLLTRSRAGAVIHGAVPLAVLTAAQVFRVFVELYLNELWKLGLVPRMMTFHGANFEIVLAASAPLVALLIARQSVSWRVVVGWNVIGLAMLANVVVRGILTAPGPLQLLVDDHVNQAIGLFPYTFIPGLMVMLGVTLHVVSLRGLLHARDLGTRPAGRGAAAITNQEMPHGT